MTMKAGMESAVGFAAGLGLVLTLGAAEPIRTVELTNGETLEAIVIPASECPVVVQTDDECVEVPLDAIRKLDGRSDVAEALRADRPPLLRNETFEELRADGDVLMHSSFSRMNRSATTRYEIDWGIAPHEVALLEHWKVYDEFGNELTLRVEDRSGGAKHVFARLVRPILPGEVVRFTSEILFRDRMPNDGGTLTYRIVGDYPDDRLVSKMVKLPAGAQIEHVSPEPAQRFEVDGTPYVYWRRYYVTGEQMPLEVAFRVE
jgi:hypothetical protein